MKPHQINADWVSLTGCSLHCDTQGFQPNAFSVFQHWSLFNLNIYALCVLSHKDKYAQLCWMCKHLKLQCHQMFTKCSFSLTLKVENVTVLPPALPHKVNYTMGKYNPDKRNSVNARQEMCVPAAPEQLAVSLWNVREEARVISPAGCLGMCRVFPQRTALSFLFLEPLL